jgi:RNA polymerase sigma factor (sigma-70 family)
MARKKIILPNGEELRGAQSPEELDLTHFFPLAKKHAKRYAKVLGSFDEAFSVACEGLVKAREAWDPRRGPFGTVAVLWVNAEVRTAADAAQKAAGVPIQERVNGKHQIKYGKRRLEERLALISGNTPIGEDGSRELQDLLPDLNSPTPEDLLIEFSEGAANIERVKKALAVLDDRELRIIRAQFFSEEPVTFKDLGVELGVSHERVRQILAAALGKCFEALTGEMSEAEKQRRDKKRAENNRRTLTPEQLEKKRARRRQYNREWKARQRADPVTREKRLAYRRVAAQRAKARKAAKAASASPSNQPVPMPA